jgi:hypothetical protein
MVIGCTTEGHDEILATRAATALVASLLALTLVGSRPPRRGLSRTRINTNLKTT